MIVEPSWDTIDAAHAAIVGEGATHRVEMQGEPHPMVTYYRPSAMRNLYPGAFGWCVLSRYSDGKFRRGAWLLAHDGLDTRATEI